MILRSTGNHLTTIQISYCMRCWIHTETSRLHLRCSTWSQQPIFPPNVIYLSWSLSIFKSFWISKGQDRHHSVCLNFVQIVVIYLVQESIFPVAVIKYKAITADGIQFLWWYLVYLEAHCMHGCKTKYPLIVLFLCNLA
jgi:hypothetical protein